MLLRIACAAFVVIIGVALFQYYSAYLRETEQARRERTRSVQIEIQRSRRITEALTAGTAKRHYKACQQYHHMLAEKIPLDDAIRHLLENNCATIK